MIISKLQTNALNQNGYNVNSYTHNRIGALFIVPVNIYFADCLSCDGFILKIKDYLKLYSAIGKEFNTGDEKDDEFRIPDYNITGEFLQPSTTASQKISSGLPNIRGTVLALARHSYHNNNYVSEALYSAQAAVTTHNIGNGGTVGYFDKIGFDASKSNPIFGRNTIVQPPARTVRVLIKYI